jgi:deoxycytidylate deaminase
MHLSGAWERGFRSAEAASLLSNGPQQGYRLGAALYAGSNLLSIGCNLWDKTTPHSHHSRYEPDPYNGNVHAEAMCLVRRLHYDNSRNLILYVSRTTTNSFRTETQAGCSRPCAKCMSLIEISGVRRVRFYNENGEPAEIKL